MKQVQVLFILSFFFGAVFAQNPETAPLPAKFNGMEALLTVDHFPSPVLASEDPGNPGIYYWKHNTSVISPAEDITIEEGGAYIYYNDQWNLRVSYSAKEFANYFDIPKAYMKAGEPYTFVQNWRTDSRLYGGWAMWYVIGKTASGKRVYGVGKLDTVGKVYEANHRF